MHVVIQAGGKGTRLEGLTHNRPKCIVPVNNRPMIFWAFEAFKEHEITVICDYKQEALTRYLSSFGQQYKVKVIAAGGTGTASGIGAAVSTIEDDEPIAVVWCDLLFSSDWQLPEFLQQPKLLTRLQNS